MRGVDTNVLVRLLTQDDPDQFRAVEALLERTAKANDRLHVTNVTLCELAWVLRSSFHMSRAKISGALQSLLEITLLEIQDRDLVEHALNDFREGSAGFPDYLIGWQNRRAGCEDTLTFDGTLAESPGFTLLS